MNLGTPAQTVKVAIDTGSDELWVNPDCSTSGSREQELECYDHGRYDPRDSSTATITDVQNYIPYGKGEVQMQYVFDNITLSDSSKFSSSYHHNYLHPKLEPFSLTRYSIIHQPANLWRRHRHQ